MSVSTEIPLPPSEYVRFVSGARPELFERAGKAIVEALVREGMVTPESTLLDVGCGRMARYLVSTPLKSYVGFDRHPGMIRWCEEEITSRAPNYRFDFFDLKSAYADADDQQAAISAASFRFPYRDQEFDSILLASVFTHMPLDEITNYLKEIHRVLKPKGKVFLSVFFSEGEPYAERISFFYQPSSFLARVSESGFRYRLHGKMGYHYHQNWYFLEHP